MPTSAAPVETTSVAFHDILSDDGTHVRAWTNDPDGRIGGPTVVLCNGLGTNAYMWPWLLDPACGVRVVSWNHRGVGGSERPRDPDHVHIEHFVQDGLSVMDHFGVERAVLMGWSMGVNTMFELTSQHPERVSGLFAVCGVPGDTFATMLAPFHLPRPVARALTVGVARLGTYVGGALTPLTRRIPVGPGLVRALGRTGFMGPVADPGAAAIGVAEFLTTPVDWYAHLALSTSRHARVSLSALRVPACFVAASRDVLAGSRYMSSAADRMADAEYHEFRSTHFLPLERPEELHGLLLSFLAKVG